MSRWARRECLGCEGQGCVNPVQHVTADCIPCGACQGTGYVSAVVSVRDAISDAETLRLNIRRYGTSVDRERLYMADCTAEALSWSGDDALSPAHAFAEARKDARDAFAAVPALRGDR